MDYIRADRSIVRASPADPAENVVHRTAFDRSPIIVVNGQKRREKRKELHVIHLIRTVRLVKRTKSV